MGNIDAVLPLTVKDLPRFEILQRSMTRFFVGLGTCWVVVPDSQVAEIGARVTDRRFTVISEYAIVPEFRAFPKYPGWMKQQIIKLSIADRVASDFYLTLDADVICTKKVTPDLLVRNGRALSHTIQQDLWPNWYVGSARLLGVKPARTGITHAVTPTVFSRQGMRELHAFLETRFFTWRWPRNRIDMEMGLVRLRYALGRLAQAQPWRLLLISDRRWTEHSIYYTYLEATGSIDRYHEWSDHCIYSVEGSVWYHQELKDWDPRDLFLKPGPPYFLVVQSNTGVDPVLVWERLGKYIDDESSTGRREATAD